MIRKLFSNLESDILNFLTWIVRYSALVGISGLIVLAVFCIANLHHYAHFPFFGDKFDMEHTGQFGDYVGGVVGTLFTLVTALLLFGTLVLQTKQMELQREELNRSEKSNRIQSFENRFFELIKLHRDNVTEIGIGDDYGKRIFVLMIREFRSAHKIVKKVLVEFKRFTDDKKESLIIAYLVFFFGTGPNSTRVLKSALKEYPSEFIDALVEQLEFYKDIEKKKKKFRFTPFEGHQSRLGHYYRHLYQSVKYVHQKKDMDIDKYEYVKTMRAQLTNHEQALLFLNSLTYLGKIWWDELMLEYKIVSNIPENFFDPETEIDITEYFSSDYFEWQK